MRLPQQKATGAYGRMVCDIRDDLTLTAQWASLAAEAVQSDGLLESICKKTRTGNDPTAKQRAVSLGATQRG